MTNEQKVTWLTSFSHFITHGYMTLVMVPAGADRVPSAHVPRGRLLVVGFASGTIPNYAVNLALLKGCSIVGVHYMVFAQKQPADAQRNIVELMQMVEDGTIRPRVDRIFTLEQAADALNYVASRQAVGKVVVTVGDG